MNDAPDSLATARANSVLPVPEGPERDVRHAWQVRGGDKSSHRSAQDTGKQRCIHRATEHDACTLHLIRERERCVVPESRMPFGSLAPMAT